MKAIANNCEHIGVFLSIENGESTEEGVSVTATDSDSESQPEANQSKLSVKLNDPSIIKDLLAHRDIICLPFQRLASARYMFTFEILNLLLCFFLSSFLPLHPFFLFFLSSFLPFFLFLAFLFSFFPILFLSSSTFCSLFIFCSLPSFSLKYIILEKYNSCRTSELNVFHEDEITGIWKPSLVRISSSLFRLYSLPLSLIPNFLNIVSTPVVPSYLMFSCILVYFPKDFRKRKSP